MPGEKSQKPQLEQKEKRYFVQFVGIAVVGLRPRQNQKIAQHVNKQKQTKPQARQPDHHLFSDGSFKEVNQKIHADKQKSRFSGPTVYFSDWEDLNLICIFVTS